MYEYKTIYKSIYLPDELWQLIKEFTFNWKKTHKQKMKITLKLINCNKTIYTRWQLFPPYHYTNDIIREEYFFRIDGAPPPNLQLVSIEKRPNANYNTAGWWCSYGWNEKLLKNKI